MLQRLTTDYINGRIEEARTRDADGIRRIALLSNRGNTKVPNDFTFILDTDRASGELFG